MLPSQLARDLIDTGICHNYQVDRGSFLDIMGLGGPKKEDYSDLGYNKGGDEEEDSEEGDPKSIGKVVTDKKELLKFDGWVFSKVAPKTIPTTDYHGPRYFGYIFNGRFCIKGDDVPWAANAVKYSFAIEYITGIKYNNVSNILIIETIFGQTGIVIPNV